MAENKNSTVADACCVKDRNQSLVRHVPEHPIRNLVLSFCKWRNGRTQADDQTFACLCGK